MRRLLVFPLLLATATACERQVPDLPPVDLAAYTDSITQWQARRHRGIAGPEGWATLVGLWWLKPGESRIGTDSSFEIALKGAHSPRLVGSVFTDGDSAWFRAAPRVKVVSDSQEVSTLRLHSDLEEKATVLRTGSLVIQYIERANATKRGVRVKDTLHTVRTSFPGLEYFPIDTAWRVTARFVARPKPDSMRIIDVLGLETRMSWPGELRFRVRGKEYSLQVIREPEDHGKNLFVMFRDSTNGHETYPAMRYTYVPPPDSLDRTVLDFNKAYSPPCAFTSFATCPLPPRGNDLPFRVPVGELYRKH